MRILTRIKLLTAFTAVAILVLGMSLAWAYAGFARMQHDVTLISALQSSYFNRSLVRDLYFKFGEPHLVEKWEHEKAITDDLLRQVLEQIQDADQSQQLTSISNSINEGDALFQRIVENNRELQAHQETRALYEENDLRLSSQMLVRAALVRDDLLLLEESERKKLDRSLMLLTVATVLFAAALSTSTILVLSFAGRVFSRRLAALHAGARIIAGGNLGYRIKSSGADELTELGGAINRMTQELESHTLALQSEISERRLAEAALKDSESRIRNIMDHAPIGMGITTPEGRYIEVNCALCQILGYSREELAGMDIRSLVHPDDAAAQFDNIERLKRGDINSCTLQKRYVRKDGRIIWGQLTESVQRDETGVPLYMIRQIEDITARKEAEEKLKQSAEEIEDLYNNAPCGYHSVDKDGIVVRINDTELAWLGLTREEVLGKRKITEFLTPESAKTFLTQFPMFLRQGYLKNEEREFVRRDGSSFPALVSATALRDAAGSFQASRSIVYDITERKKAEGTLRTFFTVIEQGPISVIITDRNAEIQYVNPRFTTVTGFAPHEVLGRNLRMFQSGRITHYAYLEMWNALTNGLAWHGEVLNRNKSNHPYWEDVHITPVKDMDGAVLNYVLVSADIAERKAAEEKMQHLANYDPLTDLPNRLLVNDRLQQALAVARRDKLRAALMFLDLDRFKPINDSLGHDIGDLVLREAARRMQGCMRESDTVGRIGGDEFVVLLPAIETEEDALRVAEKIRVALNQPFAAASYDSLSISASIGVAIYPDHGADEKSLMKNADIAMYYAKEGGRNTVKLFNPDMREGGA